MHAYYRSCIMSYRSPVRRNSVGASLGRSPLGEHVGLEAVWRWRPQLSLVCVSRTKVCNKSGKVSSPPESKGQHCGGVKQLLILSLGDNTIPRNGQPKKLCYHLHHFFSRPPPHHFSLLARWMARQRPLCSQGASPPGPIILNFFVYERCMTCYLQVCTILGQENSRT